MMHWWVGDGNGPYGGPTSMDLIYGYNSAGQVASVTQPTGSSFVDAWGQTVSSSSPPSIYNTEYDGMGRPVSLQATGAFQAMQSGVAYKQVQNTQYDPAGRLASFQMLTTGGST